MDVERTIEFILKQQARSESQMAAFDRRMAAMQKQMAGMQRQMTGIQKLVRAGMRILAKQGENINKLSAEMKELAKAQRVTDTKLQSFIDSMRRGGNGRHSRN